MNTACTGGSPSSGIARSVSNESSWLPNALRRTAMSSPPRLCWPSIAVEHRVGEHDQPGARAVDGHPGGDARLQRVGQTEQAAELVHDARLAARDHKPGDLIKFALATDRHGIRPQLAEHEQMLAEVALQGEDADPRPGLTSHARRDGAARGCRRR